MPHYSKQYERGDECADNRRAYVRLYANTPNEDTYTYSGSAVTTALENAMDQLYDWNAVSYYRIDRFDADESGQPYEHPCITEGSDISAEFESFLTTGSENGTGDNLKQDYIGSHALVHGFGCSVDTASGEPGDQCSTDGSAFRRGVMAWTGATCSGDLALASASAIQEVVHQFIKAYQSDVHDMLGDGDDDGDVDKFDEHTLGRIEGDGRVTPLLAYHADEFTSAGDCKDQSSTPSGYTETLTQCTKDAVKATGNNQCSPTQSDFC